MRFRTQDVYLKLKAVLRNNPVSETILGFFEIFSKYEEALTKIHKNGEEADRAMKVDTEDPPLMK